MLYGQITLGAVSRSVEGSTARLIETTVASLLAPALGSGEDSDERLAVDEAVIAILRA